MKKKHSTRSGTSPDAIPIYVARQAIINLWEEKKINKKGLLTDEMIEYIQQQTLDYTISAKSLNELADHMRKSKIPISEEIIRQFMEKLGDLVSKINEHIDRNVAPLIDTVEYDESFKGIDKFFFESMHHESGYLMILELIQSRKSEILREYFTILKENFGFIRRFITDLGGSYPADIDKVFEQIEHQLCQVHAIRDVFKDMRSLKTDLRKSYKSIENLKSRLKDKKNKRIEFQKAYSYYQKKLNRLEDERNQLRIFYGVVPYQKNILLLYPELKEINDKISLTRSILRGKIQSLNTSKLKIKQCENELKQLESEKNKLWADYMIGRKLLRSLIDYLKGKIKDSCKVIKIIRNLTKNTCKKLGKATIKFINKHPRLVTFHSYLNGTETFIHLISTNRIESFNGRFKKYKEIRRKWQNTPYTKGVLEILRLHFNFNRPICNRGRNKSPLEKLGFNLQGKSLYEVIFHRLFPIRIALEKTEFQLSKSGGVF
jgi:hypothetical protein